jgi:hypothetical protein
MSFDHPSEQQQRLSNEELSACKVAFEQIESGNPLPVDLRARLSSDVDVIKFPPLDFNVLWPFNFVDPRNVSEPPDYPFGRYPYGDRIVVELLREGLTGADLWDAYKKRSVEKLPSLPRLMEHEKKRLLARDARSDVKLGQLVIENYETVPLFWTINHPTGWLLARALGEVLNASKGPLGLADDVGAKAARAFAAYEPFAHEHQPIHPEVGRQLGLKWWSEDLRYRYFDGSMNTFEQFMLRYIDFK